MEALKLTAKSPNNITSLNPKTNKTEYTQLNEAELLKLFPQSRYFQIHFQHLHDNADEIKAELAECKQISSQLNAKLDALMQLFTQARF